MSLLLASLVYIGQTKAPAATSPDVVSEPSSIKPAAEEVDNYQVDPNLPKYLAIPAIGISNSRIIKQGLLNNNQIASPDNIYDVGWYKQSAEPGKAGVMFMYGHVSSWKANGIFYNLKNLKPGNRIIITRGDNATYIYEVIDTKVYDHNNVDMKAILSSTKPNEEGLNLMTCTGQLIKGTNEFDKRLAVFASRVKE